MNRMLLLVAFLAAGLFGLVVLGATLWSIPASLESDSGYALPAVAAAPPADSSGRLEALEAQLARVSQRVAELELELAEQTRRDARREVLAERPDARPASLGESGAGLGITPADRAAVVAILESVQAEEQLARDEARLEREQQRATTRAAEIAKQLGLSLADQDTLGEHLLAASAKRTELMTEVREGGFDPSGLRESFAAQREWSETQLETLFGPELAGQIQEYERQSRGFAGFGGSGGPGSGNRSRRQSREPQ